MSYPPQGSGGLTAAAGDARYLKQPSGRTQVAAVDRVIGTVYQAGSRPREVCATFKINTASSEEGWVYMAVGDTNPPSDANDVGRVGDGSGSWVSGSGETHGIIKWTVQPNEYYVFKTTTVAGAPNFTFVELWYQEL